MINLLQLKYFLHVAQTNSISETAELLYVSQPAISKQIISLEKYLGCKLFDRENNFSLTAEGKYLQDKSVNLFEDISEIECEIRKISASQKDLLNIQISSASRVVLQAISNFAKINNNIKFNIIQNQVSTTKKDLIFFSTNKEIKKSIKHKRNLVLLLKEPIKLAIPKSKYNNKNKWNLEEIIKMPFICLDSESDLRKIIDIHFDELGYKLNIVFETNNPQILHTLIGSEMGLSFIPSLTWSNISNDILLTDIENHNMHRYVYMEINMDNTISVNVQNFIQYTIDIFISLE